MASTSVSKREFSPLWGPQPPGIGPIRADSCASWDDGAHDVGAHVDVFAFHGACYAPEMEENVVEVHVPRKRVAKAPGAREERCSGARTDLGAHGRERGTGARRGARRWTKLEASCDFDGGLLGRVERMLTGSNRCSCVRTSCRMVEMWNWWKWMD